MKKIYFAIILFIAFCKALNAQNDSLERSICAGLENYYQCSLIEGDAQYFYLSYITTELNGFTLYPYITKLDNMGAPVWIKQPFNGFETGRVYQIIYDFDSSLVYSGYKSMCDVNMGNGFVEKISKIDGTTTWLKSFDNNIWDNFGKSIIQRSDSGYWVSVNNMLYQLNSNGDSITNLIYTMGNILHITATPDNCYLLNCDSGLIKIDAAGNTLYNFPATHRVSHVAVADSNFYFFDCDTVIYRVDSALNVTTQLSLVDSASQINAIVINDDTLWIMLHLKSNNISRLVKSDYNLAWLSQHDFNYFNGADLDVRDISVNANDYDLIIHEQLENGETVILKSFSKTNNATHNYNIDVGVSALVVDSSYATVDQSAGFKVVYPNAKFRVMATNYGSHPVDSFFVNAIIPNSYPNCSWPSFCMHVDTALQPGDSAWINTGWLSCGVYLATSNPGNVINYCFYSSSPDRLMDYAHSNDNTCITFNITNFVGIDEIQNNNFISVNPNPASSHLEIKSSIILNTPTVEIFDVLGNLVFEKNAETNSAFNIDINKLQQGLYFISINTEGKSWVKKFLKM